MLDRSSNRLPSWWHSPTCDDTLPRLNDATGTAAGIRVTCLAPCSLPPTRHQRRKTFITAAVTAYELYLILRAIQIATGLDMWLYRAAAAAVSRNNETRPPATAMRYSLALTPNMALGVARGPVVEWKGCAEQCGAQRRLRSPIAAEGMTAPESVFEATTVCNAVGNSTGRRSGPDRPFRIAASQIKLYPCVYPPVSRRGGTGHSLTDRSDEIEAIV